MNLALFDIDGTLVQYAKTWDSCYLQAFRELFGFKDLIVKWTEYKYSIDSGIMEEIFEQQLNRKPSRNEIQSVKKYYIKLFHEQKKRVVEVPGASVFTDKLKNDKNWAVAIATGNWKEHAILKLEHAGINYQNMPMGTADDAIERKEVMEIAIQKAKKVNQIGQFDKTIYFGDRSLDYDAAKSLGLSFIGVTNPTNIDEFKKLGITDTIENYLDDSFLN